MGILLNVLEQGLIFSIAALGVYITYKILDFPDLSVDGTFPLGAAITAKCLMLGMNPLTACVLSVVGGCIGGLATGILHVKVKINNLLSGILVMIGLYSINLRIMGKSNIPLFNKNTIFSGNMSPIVILIVFAVGVKILLDLFLKTKSGFVLKAVGDNEQLVTMLGVDKDLVVIIGLMLSNGITALAGSLMAQYQRFSDVGMGTGTVVMGLAAVVVGESIFKSIKLVKATTSAILGSILYRGAIAATLSMGLPATDLKLVTAVIVAAALYLNNRNFSLKGLRKSSQGGELIASDKQSIQSI